MVLAKNLALIPMNQIFTPPNRLKLLLAVALLSTVLVVSQISWSASAVLTPAALAGQIEADSAPIILDVRSPEEYAAGHIPGAINLPYRELPARLDELEAVKGEAIVIYCEVGVRAGIAEIALAQAGFTHLMPLEGHMQAWRKAALPIALPSPQPTP